MALSLVLLDRSPTFIVGVVSWIGDFVMFKGICQCIQVGFDILKHSGTACVDDAHEVGPKD
jgi:hypothetical protein